MSDYQDPILEGLTGAAPTHEPDAPPESAMDPAQQSLADALRITFRLLQVVMILLFVLFLASGFQTVEESERGLKLVFGRITQRDVAPGARWNAPFPIGEMIKVKTGGQQMLLDSSFGPHLSERDRTRPLDQVLPAKLQLNVAEDGSVITGDGAIAHTWWAVDWRRENPSENVENIYTPDEEWLVRRAVERGVVRAVAEMSIDALLKQGAVASGPDGGAESSLSARVRRVAQDTLDALNSGIRIEKVSLYEKSPPGSVRESFNAVGKAEAQAANERERADQIAREMLNSTAGESHAALLDLIDEYERAIELKEDAVAGETLALMGRLLDGETVEIDGRAQTASGIVTQVINDARRYRTNIVSTAQTRYSAFAAKLQQYRERPEVFVATEWGPAFKAFLESGGVEVLRLPPGTRLDLWLNRDPAIQERAERERNAREAQRSIDRLDAQRMDAYKEKLRRDAERREQENENR